MRLLKRYASRVVLAFDADAAGQGAAERVLRVGGEAPGRGVGGPSPAGARIPASSPRATRRRSRTAVADPVPFLGSGSTARWTASPAVARAARPAGRDGDGAWSTSTRTSNVRKLYAGEVAAQVGHPGGRPRADRRAGVAAPGDPGRRRSVHEGRWRTPSSLRSSCWCRTGTRSHPWLIEPLFDDDANRMAFVAMAEAEVISNGRWRWPLPTPVRCSNGRRSPTSTCSPTSKARTLIGAAARRELAAHARLVDPAAMEEDRAARLDIDALNDTDRARAMAAAESLLGWLDRRIRGTQRWELNQLPGTGRRPASPFAGVDVDGMGRTGRSRPAVGRRPRRGRRPRLRHVELSGDVLTEVAERDGRPGHRRSTTRSTTIADDTPPAAVAESWSPRIGPRRRCLPITTNSCSAGGRGRRTRKAGPKGDGSTSDTVRMYLREIGQVDLLTVEDERRLAQLIEEGKIAAARIDDVADSTTYAPGEERMLMRAVSRGERAKSELTQANLRLVVSIAKRYSGRGMQLLDLIQEGNLGLMRAVDKFDHTKGFKFSTYATWWIRQAITRSIADQARTIRIPGAHGRAHEPGHPRQAPDAPGARARADGRRDRCEGAAATRPGPRAAAVSRRTRCRSIRRSGTRTSRTSATSSRTSRSTARPTPPPG